MFISLANIYFVVIFLRRGDVAQMFINYCYILFSHLDDGFTEHVLVWMD